jgi:hypothetical protein
MRNEYPQRFVTTTFDALEIIAHCRDTHDNVAMIILKPGNTCGIQLLRCNPDHMALTKRGRWLGYQFT